MLDLADNYTSAEDLVSQEEFEELQDYEKGGKFLGAKVLLDFAYALQYAYDTSSAPYFAIFEDDMIFAHGWLSRTILALRDIEKKLKRSKKDWLDLRLFKNESNSGFASHDILGNNVPVIIALISSTVFGLLLLLRQKTIRGQKIITFKLCFVICCVTIPLFVIFFFQAGKSSVLPPSPGIAVQSWGLGTVGAILPRHQILNLIRELKRRKYTQPDIVILNYALDNGLERFVLNPVQVQHLGTLSDFTCCFLSLYLTKFQRL
jgi:hypothetical protein